MEPTTNTPANNPAPEEIKAEPQDQPTTEKSVIEQAEELKK